MPDTTAHEVILGPVAEELRSIKGRKVFFDPLVGNNGDRLHRMGSREALRRAGGQFVNRPENAEVIVMNGGAAMTVQWKYGLELLDRYSKRFPNTELWVMPATYDIAGYDFAASFAGRTAPARLYCRERYSFEMLRPITFSTDVRLGVDHDMAFHLLDSDYLRSLQAKCDQRHILVVERDDQESSTGLAGKAVPVPRGLKDLVPRSIKLALKRLHYRHITAPRSLDRPFIKKAVERVLADYPQFREMAVLPWDISHEDVCSFKDFGLVIAQAAAVVSTRLHVGILGSLLDKPVYVQFGTVLPHKFRGIYELSLADNPKVKVL